MRIYISKMLVKQIVEKDIRPALAEIGVKLVHSIKTSMVPGFGRTYRSGGGVHIASIPGQPPSPWSGRLRDSITYQTTFGDKIGVGAAAKSSDAIKKPKRAMGGHALSVGSNGESALAM